jgi:hypothetical protein
VRASLKVIGGERIETAQGEAELQKIPGVIAPRQGLHLGLRSRKKRFFEVLNG